MLAPNHTLLTVHDAPAVGRGREALAVLHIESGRHHPPDLALSGRLPGHGVAVASDEPAPVAREAERTLPVVSSSSMGSSSTSSSSTAMSDSRFSPCATSSVPVAAIGTAQPTTSLSARTDAMRLQVEDRRWTMERRLPYNRVAKQQPQHAVYRLVWVNANRRHRRPFNQVLRRKGVMMGLDDEQQEGTSS